MELISSTGLFSKGCFYDNHCVYRGKKYNYSEMTSVHACDGTIITNEKIELNFFTEQTSYTAFLLIQNTSIIYHPCINI